MPAEEAILIDSSIWIKGQRDPKWLDSVIGAQTDVATCDVAVGEFAVGLYAPREKKTRQEVREFYDRAISASPGSRTHQRTSGPPPASLVMPFSIAARDLLSPMA